MSGSDELRPYRTFWRRFWAGWIDTAVLLPLVFVDEWIWESVRSTAVLVAWWLFNSLSFSAYSVLLHGMTGQTVGKWLMGVRVYDLGGGKLSMKQALMRDIVYIILLAYGLASDLPYVIAGGNPYAGDREPDLALWISVYALFAWFLLELLTMLSNPKRRAIHDFIAGSVVMRTNTLLRRS